jgi:hypothetical protein
MLQDGSREDQIVLPRDAGRRDIADHHRVIGSGRRLREFILGNVQTDDVEPELFLRLEGNGRVLAAADIEDTQPRLEQAGEHMVAESELAVLSAAGHDARHEIALPARDIAIPFNKPA